MSRCSSANAFGGSGMPSGVFTVARRSAAPRLRGGTTAQGWFEVANAHPGQGGLYPVHNARAFPHQAFALPIGPLGVLFEQSLARAPCCNGPVLHAATPKTRASAIRCPVGRSLPGD